jgi:DNA polymerase III subunit alpha
VAGIVTSVEHRITKNGKPFGRMSMEDFSDTHTFTFFSPDYLTFKNYMQPGYAVMLTGKVEAHRFNDGEFEFKVKEMNLLADVGEKMIKASCLPFHP